MFNPFSLTNEKIIVTGASSGIGRQIAIDCSRMGAKVIAIARDEVRLRETISLCNNPSLHTFYSYDLKIIDGIADLVKRIVNDCGKVNGFVHSAGIEKTAPLKLLSHNDFESIMKTNAYSGFEFVRQLSQKRYSEDASHFVFITSITAVVGRLGVSAYSASKGAIVSAIKPMAMELCHRNHCVNCISPGTILTPMMQHFLKELTPEQYEKRVEGYLLGLGQCSDISNACIYLLSDASRWVTGQNFIVDGGYTVR